MAVALAKTAAAVKGAQGMKAPRVKMRGGYGAAQRPVITSITVLAGLGVLRSVVVDSKPLPDRQFWVSVATIGFILSLMAEITPKLGKNMAYLVMTAAIFSQSAKVLEAVRKPPPKATMGTGGGPDGGPGTVPVALRAAQRDTITLTSGSTPPTIGYIPGKRNMPTRRVRPRRRYVDPYSQIV